MGRNQSTLQRKSKHGAASARWCDQLQQSNKRAHKKPTAHRPHSSSCQKNCFRKQQQQQQQPQRLLTCRMISKAACEAAPARTQMADANITIPTAVAAAAALTAAAK
jgi:hypothetical protein